MNPAIAAEFALLLLSEDAQRPQPQARATPLTPREQELVTLVARGTTDAQIAAQLYISVRTVRSHLDRIRDKTGCRSSQMVASVVPSGLNVIGIEPDPDLVPADDHMRGGKHGAVGDPVTATPAGRPAVI